MVLETLDERVVLLGEAKWSESPFNIPKPCNQAKACLKRGILPVRGLREKDLCRVVFVPKLTHDAPGEKDGVLVATGNQVLSVKP